MLAKKFRFHGHGSLRFLYTKGSQVRSKHLSIKYIDNPKRQNSRFTVVVSKKVTKKAPIRNRIRRRISEVIQGEWNQLRSPVDILVTVFDEHLADIDHKELEKIIQGLLQKAKLYK